MNHSISLILEGGGLRGIYSAGILECLMDAHIQFPAVYGVSMGACNAANFISGQAKRNRCVSIDYVNDPRYLSFRRLFSHGELFGMDFIFDTLPNKLNLFDYDAFFKNPARFVIGTTDIVTGKAIYYEKNNQSDILRILQASSSLPMISKPVYHDGRLLMDGGLADAIPLAKSIEDGNTKHVIILTRPASYRKEKTRGAAFMPLLYHRYPGLCHCLKTRHIRYNKTLDDIAAREQAGEVFVFRPETALRPRRIERNQELLHEAYDIGYQQAKKALPQLLEFLK